MARKKTVGRSTHRPAEVRESAGHQGSGLAPRQARFVKEYLVDLNGTQAAIRSGYSSRTANEQAARLLANVYVKTAVEAGAAKQHAQLDLTAEKVLAELLRIGHAEVATADIRVRHANIRAGSSR